jgi:hypothetical protein
MAIYPDDYRKIVTKVTQKGSRIAVEARNLITDWASKCHSIRRTRVQLAAYQLVVLVELTFKVMVICSISTEYNFNMDGQAGS